MRLEAGCSSLRQWWMVVRRADAHVRCHELVLTKTLHLQPDPATSLLQPTVFAANARKLELTLLSDFASVCSQVREAVNCPQLGNRVV